MSFAETIAINQMPGAGNDAFGRLRTSGTGSRLDTEFIYDKQVDFFDEVTTNGTVTHNANGRDLTLALTSAADGNEAHMASHPVPYTPGNSQLIDITGTLDLADIGTGAVEVFLRSSISGTPADLTTVSQASWLTMTSGVDWSTSHIFQMDFQSLKVGTIRFNIVADGVPTQVAQINNDNLRSGGYWQTPSLPVFWHIHIVGTETIMEIGYGDANNAIGFRYTLPTANASATMLAVCATVKSEGGKPLAEIEGLPRVADNGGTVVSAASTTVLQPIISIRPRATFQSLPNLGIAFPKGYTSQTNNPIKLAVIIGGTLTGPTWADVDTSNSMMEFDVASSAISGGRIVGSDYQSTVGKNKADTAQGLLGKSVLWDRQSTETGIFTLAALKTTGTTADILAAINWSEIR